MAITLRVNLVRSLLCLAFLLLPVLHINAQEDKVAELRRAVAQNKQALMQYQWVETTTISYKGEEKSRVVKQCFYGPNGQIQKQEFNTAPTQPEPRGLKGKMVNKKKNEMQDYMERAQVLITQYIPPEPDRIQAAKDAGSISVTPQGDGTIQLLILNFVKAMDQFSLNIYPSTSLIQKITIKSYLEDEPKQVITMDVAFTTMSSGVNHPSKTVLSAPEKNIQVVTQNSNYQIRQQAN